MVRCYDNACEYNEEGHCQKIEHSECGKDLLKCWRCGEEVFLLNPLDKEKCPKCGSKYWDGLPAECYNCNHVWNNRVGLPKYCPNCNQELKSI